MKVAAALLLGLLLVGCDAGPPRAKAPQDHAGPFPAADRPVAHIISSRWSTEEARDRLNEASEVMNKAGIKPGMTVADIGAGEGYYTIRLGQRGGQEGPRRRRRYRAAVTEALAERVLRERQLGNVFVQLGLPANPRLPECELRPDPDGSYVP